MSGRMFQMHHAESGIPVPNARVQGTGKRAYGSIEPRSQSTHTRTVISSSTKRTTPLLSTLTSKEPCSKSPVEHKVDANKHEPW